MGVCLDLDGILFQFAIDGYKPSTNEMWDQEWCHCELQLTSGNWLNLERRGELFLNSEIEGIFHHMKKLLNSEDVGESKEIEFMEPDFRLVLHPIKDRRKKSFYCAPGYEFQDILIEWKTYLWNEGLTENYMTVALYREDIQKIVDYLSEFIEGHKFCP